MLIIGTETAQEIANNKVIQQIIQNYTAAGIIRPGEQKLLMLCLIPLDNLELLLQLLQSHQWAEIAGN